MPGGLTLGFATRLLLTIVVVEVDELCCFIALYTGSAGVCRPVADTVRSDWLLPRSRDRT